MHKKTSRWPNFRLAACVLMSQLPLVSSTAVAVDSRRIVPVSEIEHVAIDQVRLDDGTLRGVVTNRSDARVEALELRVTYQWRWHDEFNPAIDGAGFSDTLRLEAPLASGEQREFTYMPSERLPVREDGELVPSVSIVGFTVYAQ